VHNGAPVRVGVYVNAGMCICGCVKVLVYACEWFSVYVCMFGVCLRVFMCVCVCVCMCVCVGECV